MSSTAASGPTYEDAEPLRRAFYQRPVLEVARDLVGCVLQHENCTGVIVETEAYHVSEAACHAYVGLTPRTATLFGTPGKAYVYRSYGIHALLNAVCEPEGVGAAVLIRALEPFEGLEQMRRRRGLEAERSLCSGPGRLTVALGIELHHNNGDLEHGPVVILPRPSAWREVAILTDRRIGITRAVELPWRFCAAGSRFLSRPVARRLMATDAGAAGAPGPATAASPAGSATAAAPGGAAASPDGASAGPSGPGGAATAASPGGAASSGATATASGPAGSATATAGASATPSGPAAARAPVGRGRPARSAAGS